MTPRTQQHARSTFVLTAAIALLPALAAASILSPAPVTLAIEQPVRPIVADWDGDTRPDLAFFAHGSWGYGADVWNNSASGWVHTGGWGFLDYYMTKRAIRHAGNSGPFDLDYTILDNPTQTSRIARLLNNGSGGFVDEGAVSSAMNGYCRQMSGAVNLNNAQGPGYKVIAACDSRYTPGHTSEGGLYYFKLPLATANGAVFEPTTYAVNNVVSADFNADGLADLAYGSMETVPGFPDIYHLTVRLRATTTTWGADNDQVVPSCFGEDFYAIDLNGDSRPDLALASPNGFQVALNNGSGGFGAPVDVPTPVGRGIERNVLGDLNGDGFPDLVQTGYSAGNAGPVLDSYGFWVRLNNHSGGFGPGTYYPIRENYLPAGYFSVEAALADFDQDGRLDVMISEYGEDRMTFYPGKGNGKVQCPLPAFSLGSDPAYCLSLGDVDNDGLRDISVGFQSATSSLKVMRSTGGGAFHAAESYDCGPDVTQIEVGDANDDGLPDLFLGRRFDPPAYLPGSFGTFDPVVPLDALADGSGLAWSSGLVVHDYNNDGRDDLFMALRSAGHAEMRMSSSTIGAYDPHQDFQISMDMYGMALAEVNGNSIPDIVAVANGSGGHGQATAMVFPGYALNYIFIPTFSSIADHPVDYASHYFAMAKRLPGPGPVDMIMLDGFSTIHIERPHPDYRFTDLATVSVPLHPYGIAAGDLNGDGIVDLAVACTYDDQVLVYEGNPNGTYKTPESMPVTSPVDLQIADVTGDGLNDLMVLSSVPWYEPRPNGPTHGGGFRAARTLSGGVSGIVTVASEGIPQAIVGVTPEMPSFPARLSLRASPNPSADETKLEFVLAERGHVKLDVFDVRGRRIATLADGEMDAGARFVAWDGRDERGGAAAAGVYLARIQTAAGTATRRIVRMR